MDAVSNFIILLSFASPSFALQTQLPQFGCANWCESHTKSWAIKCGPGPKRPLWNNGACANCSQCSTTALNYTCPPDYTKDACEPRGTPNQTSVVIGSGPNCASGRGGFYSIDCPGGGQIYDYAFSNCGGGSGPESCCNCWSLGEPLTPAPPTPPTPAPPPPARRCDPWCERNTQDWWFKCQWGACATCLPCEFPTDCPEPGESCDMPEIPCCPHLICEKAPWEGPTNYSCTDPDRASS